MSEQVLTITSYGQDRFYPAFPSPLRAYNPNDRSENNVPLFVLSLHI